MGGDIGQSLETTITSNSGSQDATIVNIMRNALNTNWSTVDDFQFTFHNKKRPLKVEGNGMGEQDVYDVAIINIDLPQMGSTVESVMQAGEWRVYNAKFQPFNLTITFRDFASLDLRNYFMQIWMDAQRGYFDEVRSTVTVSMRGEEVFRSDDCLISAVSQVQLSNNDNQIAEFTVEFNTPYFSNSSIKKFGTDKFKNENGSGVSADKLFGTPKIPSGSILGGLTDSINKVKNWF